MKNTRVVSGGRRGGSVLAGERKGSGSHSRESGEVAACSLAREREGDGSRLRLVLGRSGTERKHWNRC